MAATRILIVEDDEDIVELLAYNLKREGYEIEWVGNGKEVQNECHHFRPHLILLDLMLPEMDGLEVCRRLKANDSTSGIPIIMITARGEDSAMVSGLELGADDYVAKPFQPRVLLARIHAVLRRYENQDHDKDEIKVDRILIRPRQHQVFVDQDEVQLTYMEFKLLEALASHPGWVFTRRQIVDTIRGQGYAVTDRAVDVLVVGLRKKLGDYAKMIETVRGVGYRFQEV